MRLREQYILEALRRIQDFMTANGAVLGALNTGQARANLDALVTTLTANAATQGGNKTQAMGETANQKALRTTLLETHMRPIASVAKGATTRVPELSAVKLPDTRTHSQALLNSAAAMVQAVTPYEQTFLSAGLAPTFLTDVQAAATALQTSVDARSSLKVNGSGATATIADDSRAAHSVILVLNAQILRLLAGNTTLITAWNAAKRITSKPGVPIGTSVVTPVVPPASPTPAATGTPLTPATPAAVPTKTAAQTPAPIPAEVGHTTSEAHPASTVTEEVKAA